MDKIFNICYTVHVYYIYCVCFVGYQLLRKLQEWTGSSANLRNGQ